jgi:DNA-binding transcriptional ArsR family regulator
MAKERLTGWLHEPLTAVLGTRGKVAVLRILWRAETAIPYREVVRRSGMAYRSIDLALGELTQAGLVEELSGGRERRVRLCSGHRLAPAIATLMQVEADFFAALRVELRTVAEASRRDGLLGAAIVGAAARREEVLGSPLEVVVVLAETSGVPRCRAAFDVATGTIASRFGAGLTVMLYDLAGARAMWRGATPAAARNVRESEWLAGSSLSVLLDE